MIPERPIVLHGEAARQFEEYMNREPTKEELEYVKQADKVYKAHPV